MGWLQGWSYRRPITVTEQSGQDLTDYQILITLDSSNFDFTKANADGSDIRFTEDDGVTTLPYYIESWDGSNQQAKIWVKISSLLANSSITIYMYYGNSSATSESDSSVVFIFYDDFNDGVIDEKWDVSALASAVEEDGYLKTEANANTWANYDSAAIANVNIQGNFYAETKLTYLHRTSDLAHLYLMLEGTNGHLYGGLYDAWASEAPVYGIGAGNVGATSGKISETGTIIIKIWRIGDNTTARVEGDVVLEKTGTFTDTLTKLKLTNTRYQTYAGRTAEWDYVIIRNYTDPEPTISIGDESSASSDSVLLNKLSSDIVKIGDVIYNDVTSNVVDRFGILDRMILGLSITQNNTVEFGDVICNNITKKMDDGFDISDKAIFSPVIERSDVMSVIDSRSVEVTIVDEDVIIPSDVNIFDIEYNLYSIVNTTDTETTRASVSNSDLVKMVDGYNDVIGVMKSDDMLISDVLTKGIDFNLTVDVLNIGDDVYRMIDVYAFDSYLSTDEMIKDVLIFEFDVVDISEVKRFLIEKLFNGQITVTDAINHIVGYLYNVILNEMVNCIDGYRRYIEKKGLERITVLDVKVLLTYRKFLEKILTSDLVAKLYEVRFDGRISVTDEDIKELLMNLNEILEVFEKLKNDVGINHADKVNILDGRSVWIDRFIEESVVIKDKGIKKAVLRITDEFNVLSEKITNIAEELSENVGILDYDIKSIDKIYGEDLTIEDILNLSKHLIVILEDVMDLVDALSKRANCELLDYMELLDVLEVAGRLIKQIFEILSRIQKVLSLTSVFSVEMEVESRITDMERIRVIRNERIDGI